MERSARAPRLWLLDTARVPECLMRSEEWLSSSERQRADRFVGDAKRRQFVVVHGFTRWVLSHHADVDPDEWRFETGPHGRPEAMPPAPRAGTVDLRFNLSHTDGMAAVVVTERVDCGVDVEGFDRPTDPLGPSRLVLAAQELADLTSMSEADRLERFLQYWTLKEAYIKATGVGFALPLKQIAFDLRDPGRISVQAGPVVGDRPDEWQFRTWRTARHEVSVALRTGRRDDAVAVDVERVPAPRSASSHPGGSALLR